MDLMPKVSKDFSSKRYWESFFKKRRTAFEWYGSHFELCGVLNRYIKKTENILVSGCGNSKLSEDLYDSGFKDITNIDISKTAVKQMSKINETRKEMKWLEMDVNKMNFPNQHFSVIIDKGTLDAMMSSEEGCAKIEVMFGEIYRILRNGGRYICVSLAQDHVLQKLLSYFPANNWLLRVHKIWVAEDHTTGGPKMPLFAFVLTKFANLPRKILEICLADSDQPKRLQTEEEMIEIVKSQQYYAMVKNELNKNEATNEPPMIELFTSDKVDVARYRIYVVDSKDAAEKFAVFVVPNGKEHDWMFATKKGRMMLASNVSYKRLLVVLLSRHHDYESLSNEGSLNTIQDELSTRVMELAPHELSKSYKVPILTSGQIGLRQIVHQFQVGSLKYIVEDYIDTKDCWKRRLVLERHPNITNLSLLCCVEACMSLKNAHKKKSKTRKSLKTINSKVLADSISQLQFGCISQFKKDMKRNLGILHFGFASSLGLLTYLQTYMCDASNVVVDKSEELLNVAKKFFNVNMDLVKVHPFEFADFFDEFKNTQSTFDVVTMKVYLDEDSSLVDPLYIESVHSILNDTGIFLLKLAVNNDEFPSANSVIKSLEKTFKAVTTYFDVNSSHLLVVCNKQDKTCSFLEKKVVDSLHRDMDVDELRKLVENL